MSDEVRTLVVDARRDEARDVVGLTLVPPDGAPALPDWTPGAHVDVILGPGVVRQYSLCGNASAGQPWRIAVLREQGGRGGSVAVHDRLHAGSTVQVRGPRNHFGLDPAPAYLFVAGGIGITPILPMLRAATDAGVPWRLAYGGRTAASMAFVAELRALEGPAGRVDLYPQDQVGLLPVSELVDWAAAERADVYCCGPEPLIEAVEKEGRGLGAGRVHVERFRAPQAPATGGSADGSADGSGAAAADGPFELEVLPAGVVLTVPAGRSALEAMEDAGCAPLSSCREGTCGTCEVRIVSGTVDHRDWLLSDAEKADGDAMFVCVSRSRDGGRLVVEV